VANKEVKVKSYRTKDGKRVKQFRRRQKIAAGVAGIAAVGGLVAAVKNKKSIGKLINNAKSKNNKVDFSIPSTAKVPETYTIKPRENARLSTVDMHFDNQSFNISMDEKSSEYLGSYTAQKIMSEKNSSLFLSYKNEKGELEHFIKGKIDLLGEADYQGRPLSAILDLKLPKDVDPQGFDFEYLKEKIQSDPKAINIFRDNYNRRRVDESFANPKEDLLYIENLISSIPSTSDSTRAPKDLRKIRDAK
jgi:hypothetical protein